MSKRAVSFADSVETRTYNSEELPANLIDNDDEAPSKPVTEFETDEDGIPVRKKGKHTLDSDEEDNDDHQELDMRKVEGQEECELDFDGNTKITAFNMKEDMEEGHFDSMGNFIFNKKEKEIHDAWLDDIDWASVKKKAGQQWEKSEEDAEDDEAPAVLNDSRRREIFTELLAILKPELTITRALAEIKKKTGLTAAEERKLRWAAKKAGKSLEQTSEQKDTTKLSSLADELISAGHMDAYEWTRERIEQMLKKMDNTATDSLDMFSDEPATTSLSADNSKSAEEELKWEYKESEDSPITGPFTSSEMAAKQEKGELASKGLARKCGSGGFNPVARIDFDLYC